MLNLYGSKCGPDGPPKFEEEKNSISPSTGGLAGKVLLAFSYKKRVKLYRPGRRPLMLALISKD